MIEGASSRIHIAVADDDGDLRACMEEVIRAEGYAVTGVPDGAMLIAEMERAHVSLAVVDLVMPRVNGGEVIRRTRTANKTTPFVLITALPGFIPDDIEGLGGVTVLPKPFSRAALVAAVSASLAHAVLPHDDDRHRLDE